MSVGDDRAVFCQRGPPSKTTIPLIVKTPVLLRERTIHVFTSAGMQPLLVLLLLLLSLNREGRWGTTDDFTASFLHFSLFSSALWDLANSRPVHSLILSSHFFFCLLCNRLPFTMPCKMVLARPDERETCLYICSLRLFTMVRRSCGPISCWILARTLSLVTRYLYEMRSILS